MRICYLLAEALAQSPELGGHGTPHFPVEVLAEQQTARQDSIGNRRSNLGKNTDEVGGEHAGGIGQRDIRELGEAGLNGLRNHKGGQRENSRAEESSPAGERVAREAREVAQGCLTQRIEVFVGEQAVVHADLQSFCTLAQQTFVPAGDCLLEHQGEEYQDERVELVDGFPRVAEEEGQIEEDLPSVSRLPTDRSRSGLLVASRRRAFSSSERSSGSSWESTGCLLWGEGGACLGGESEFVELNATRIRSGFH